VKQFLWFVAWAHGDCTPGDVVVKIEVKSKNGVVELTPGEGLPTYKSGDVREACNKKKQRGVNLFYRANSGYTGEDNFSVFVIWPSGGAKQVNYKMIVK
jgi:hypothetical protein